MDASTRANLRTVFPEKSAEQLDRVAEAHDRLKAAIPGLDINTILNILKNLPAFIAIGQQVWQEIQNILHPPAPVPTPPAPTPAADTQS